MKGVYRFNFDAGRNGSLTGIFVADDEAVRSVIGSEAYFGEVLGKHSEIQGTIEADHITLVTQDQEFATKFEALGCETGFSPWDGLDADDDREPIDDDE